jgi:hypothetical protein
MAANRSGVCNGVYGVLAHGRHNVLLASRYASTRPAFSKPSDTRDGSVVRPRQSSVSSCRLKVKHLRTQKPTFFLSVSLPRFFMLRKKGRVREAIAFEHTARRPGNRAATICRELSLPATSPRFWPRAGSKNQAGDPECAMLANLMI